MKTMNIEFRYGIPDKDGTYYCLRRFISTHDLRRTKYLLNIDTLSFTVKGGWNTHINQAGEVSAGPVDYREYLYAPAQEWKGDI